MDALSFRVALEDIRCPKALHQREVEMAGSQRGWDGIWKEQRGEK